MAQSEKLKNFLKTFGPGIMFAGTCIGGSHLVQSTRAGANYGFELLLIILLANLFKYPFFEFASRYTNATGETILQGFKRIGNWTLYLYGVITFFSMFVVTAAILLVTGGLLENLFGGEAGTILYWIGGLSIIVFILISVGQFSFLDSALKVIGVFLLLSVVSATIMVLANGRPEPVSGFQSTSPWTNTGFLFVIGLMGWMPMGVDMSAWGSIWTKERIKQTGYHPTLKETLLDFNIGYGITVFLALCFLALGAYTFYGSGIELSSSAVVYADQLVSLFTKNIGDWSYFIIAIAAFSTMFGTSLTLVDGYSRSIKQTFALIKENKENEIEAKLSKTWTAIIIIGGYLIVVVSIGFELLNLKSLLDVATGLSFIIAPIAGWLNFKIVHLKEFPKTHKPGKVIHFLAIAGLIFLSTFALIYILNLLDVKFFEN